MMRRVLCGVLGVLLAVGLAGGRAGAEGSGPPRLKFDNKAPIEISADTLEVRDREELAVFAGKVKVTQGEMILRADRLEVQYAGSGAARLGGGEAKPAEPAPAAGASDGSSDIRQIDAIGNVFVSSKQDTAQGERAVYEPGAGTVVMTGKVVLTRGDNVLEGAKLVIDLKSGRSVMTGGGTDGRVKGLIVPKQQ